MVRMYLFTRLVEVSISTRVCSYCCQWPSAWSIWYGYDGSKSTLHERTSPSPSYMAWSDSFTQPPWAPKNTSSERVDPFRSPVLKRSTKKIDWIPLGAISFRNENLCLKRDALIKAERRFSLWFGICVFAVDFHSKYNTRQLWFTSKAARCLVFCWC